MQQQNEVNTLGEDRGGAVCSAGSVGMLLGGMAAGAALMYLFDPDRGRGRRARLSDQAASKINRFGDAASTQTRHLRNRAQGLMHEAGSLFNRRGQDEGDGNGRDTNQPALGATPPTPAPAQGM